MPAARTVLLLPPSENKAAGGTGDPWVPDGPGLPGLGAARVELLRALRRRGALARLAPADRERTLAAVGAPTLPALQRYTGVLYDSLDLASLPSVVRRRARDRVAVISGLAGVVLGGEPVPDYKLPIGTVVPSLGGLGRWWRPRLSPALDAFVAGAVVWDLLPAAHASAWAAAGSWRPAGRRWRVRVLREAPDGTRSVVSHDNKSTKGSLARFVLEASPRRPEALREWNGPLGARWDPETSVLDADGGILDIVTTAP